MATAQVKVQYKNDPKPGKKNGSIKTADNQYYGVPPHLLNQFQPGGSYSVEYDSHEYNGNWYKTVSKVTPLAAPVDNVVRGKFGATDDKTTERIFCCGLLNAAVQAGQISVLDPSQLSTAVTACRSVWATTFGRTAATAPQPNQQPTNQPPLQQQPPQSLSDEMSDSIPF